jgi:hypothetical protein
MDQGIGIAFGVPETIMEKQMVATLNHEVEQA